MIGALGKGMLTIADGPEMPSVDDFLPDPFVFQGTPFAINRIILVRILAAVYKRDNPNAASEVIELIIVVAMMKDDSGLLSLSSDEPSGEKEGEGMLFHVCV